MKFKHKHKNHQRSNSPHKSPLRKTSKSGIPEEQHAQIKSPIFEFQQASVREALRGQVREPVVILCPNQEAQHEST